MKSLIVYVTLFLLGVGFGLGAPFLASRYAQPYLPRFFQETVHPLTGTVTHKEREQDRLLMTVTTQDGTILATFRKRQVSAPAPPPPSSIEPEPLSDSQLNPSPASGETSENTEPSPIPLN
jgi:hypothetical protein